MFLPYGTYHFVIFLYLESFINGRFTSYKFKVLSNYFFFNTIDKCLVFFFGM